MNSPRFPPVDRSLSSDSKNNIYNQLRPHHIDDRNYYESQSISRASASKQILPPLESSGRKQTKSIASKSGKITMMIIIAMCFIFKTLLLFLSKFLYISPFYAFLILAVIIENHQSGIPIPTKRKLTSAKSMSSLYNPDDSGNKFINLIIIKTLWNTKLISKIFQIAKC